MIREAKILHALSALLLWTRLALLCAPRPFKRDFYVGGQQPLQCDSGAGVTY